MNSLYLKFNNQILILTLCFFNLINVSLGVIKRQSIQGSLFLYIGVLIGFFISIILFPKILTEEEIGLLNTLVAYSIVFAQFGTLGFNNVIIKMFTYFRNHKNNHNGFFSIVLSVIFIGFIVSTIIFFILKPYIIEENIKNSPLFVKYIYFLLPLIFFTLIFYILDTYYTVLFQAVRGLFLKEFVQRILIFFTIIVYYFQLININSFIIAYIISLSIPAIIIILWLVYDREFIIKPNFSFISKKLRNTMLNVGFFGILTSIAGNATAQIDKAMSSSMISLHTTGIYSTVIVFAILIKTPSRAIMKISMPVIADAWKENDIKTIKKVYVSTSLNQFIIAALVFIGIWSNIDNIFRILPEGYDAGKYVILIIGLAYTFEMAAGINMTIIGSSKHYKYLTWFSIFTLFLIIITNLIFIPIWQINGLAIASAISISIFTFVKVLFIYLKFKIQPFNNRFIIVAVISVVVYFISSFIPFLNNLYIDIAVRSAFITLIFGIFILLFKVSSDINNTFNSIVKKIKTKYY